MSTPTGCIPTNILYLFDYIIYILYMRTQIKIIDDTLVKLNRLMILRRVQDA